MTTPHLGPGFHDPHLAARLANVEESQAETRQILRSVDKSLKALVRLEAHHNETRQAVTRLEALADARGLALKDMEAFRVDASRRIQELEDGEESRNERMAKVERSLPELHLTSRWVKGAVLGAAMMVAGLFGGVAVERIRTWLNPQQPETPAVQPQTTEDPPRR